MADTDPDDIYNDPATIGSTDDDVTGAPDTEVPSDASDLSDSIYTPEKDTTDLDDRGPIDELEAADRKDTSDKDDDLDPALRDDAPSSQDGDDYDPASEVIADEQDGTEH